MDRTKLIGARVEIAGPWSGPHTGAGRRGTVVAVHEIDTDITGMRLRYLRADVRLDSGEVISREPRELRRVSEAT